MTECERLIENGTFSPDFFKEEVRCDFLVTTERKKLWAVEIDLLMQFDKVCRKYGLKYCLLFGSLLGAVRHRGFVPWDDDMDVVMPRRDYEIFLGLKDEFNEPYFFQTPYTDKGHGYCHVQLRNSNTTGAAQQFWYQGFNLGIFIDILALDAFEYSEHGREIFTKINRLQRDNSTYMRMTNPFLSDVDIERVKMYRAVDRNPLLDYEEIRTLSMSFAGCSTGKVCCTTTTTYGFDRDIFDAASFEDYTYMKFEGFPVPVPIGWDDVLRTIYGDYMSMPPVEQRGVWHGTVAFEPDIPYKEFLASRGISSTLE